MTTVLLSIHVLAAIVLIGPMTAAASLFPRYARAAAAARLTDRPDDPDHGPAGPVAVARAMHRISRGYAAPALVVPVFGIVVGARMGSLGQVWLSVSMLLTLVAAVLLVAGIVPGQRRVLTALTDAGSTVVPPAVLSRLAMTTGFFALTWAVVVVLMISRPGSTTGVGLPL